MKNRKTLIVTACLFLLNLSAFAQEVWTIGPMLHVNFGSGKPSVSFAIEGAYWDISNFPYSVDFGIEFDRRKKTRLYSEFQTGIGLAGVSLGPVLQFDRTEHNTKLGLQGTVWVNYYIGLDYECASSAVRKAWP